MPEGDTVHKIAAALRPQLLGKELRLARLPQRTGEERLPASLRRHPRVGPTDRPGAEDRELLGRRVTAVTARGKHLFIAVEGGLLLRSHLGMYGSWHRYDPDQAWRKPHWQASLVLGTEQDVLVCFNAMEVELLKADGIGHRTLQGRLGGDLLASRFDPQVAVARARDLLDTESPLVDFLLDQRIAAGVGNVYKSEVLFLERHHPLRPLDRMADAALESLLLRARELLAQNLGRGPRITRGGEQGGDGLWVYARRGRPCLRCGSAIGYLRCGRGFRSTYWCPSCQRAAGSDSG